MARTKKEQMQLIILGTVVAGVALFAAVNFLLVPMIDEWKQDVERTRQMRQKLEETRVVVRARADVLAQVADERARVNALIKNIPLPVLGNYLLGMVAQIRDCAVQTRLQVLTVTPSDVVPLNYAENVCLIHRIRVTAEGDVNDLVDFMERLEAMNPLVTVYALSITAQPGNPEKHQISMVVGWLVWANPEQIPDYITGLQPEPVE